MKLHCHRPSLVAALQVVSGVVPSRTTKDVLKNIKLQVEDGRATLIGTDQEVGIRYEIPGVETDSVGEALLPTQRVMSIVREFVDESIEIEVDDRTLWIRSGSSEFQLASEDPAEFPTVPGFDEQSYLKIGGNELREMIHRTEFATDVESTRYALGGVLLDHDPKKQTLTLAATDSRRLAVVSGPCQFEGTAESSRRAPVIPAKAMKLIERSLGDENEEVLIAIHDNDAVIKSNRGTIYCRLVEGRFPDYKGVIPAESKQRVDLLVGTFHTAVRQAQIVTNEESRGVDFCFADGKMTLNSRAADIGASRVELPIAYDGEQLIVQFDPRYVADFLRVLSPEQQIELSLIDDESPAVFRTQDGYTYVVMPLSRDR